MIYLEVVRKIIRQVFNVENILCVCMEQNHGCLRTTRAYPDVRNRSELASGIQYNLLPVPK